MPDSTVMHDVVLNLGLPSLNLNRPLSVSVDESTVGNLNVIAAINEGYFAKDSEK